MAVDPTAAARESTPSSPHGSALLSQLLGDREAGAEATSAASVKQGTASGTTACKGMASDSFETTRF